MIKLQDKDFKDHWAKILEQIELGESCVIFRGDKPIAEILAITDKKAGWKRPIKRIKLSGNQLTSQVIVDERNR
ncbi:MAG: hypothetical protein IEMM0008_1088 [bacterium]|nr:MAG: hypothetical protein IEMM0008_1088 [bacterium]